MRGGIYTRLSQDPDGTQTATARQRKDCERLATANGIKVVTVYEDVDVSGYKRDVVRPEWERMLSEIEAGDVDVILIYRSDRLTRHPEQLERFLRAVEHHGVKLLSVTEGFSLDDDSGLFVLRLMVSVAWQESRVKGSRVRRKWQEKAEAGGPHIGGRRPFGYESDFVTVNKAEAKLIRQAAKRILRGESVRSIAVDWNERGVRTPSGNEWATTPLARMLRSPRLIGARTHNGEIVHESAWPAVLDRETWQQVQRRRWSRKPASKHAHLLTGVVHCGREGCGANLYTTTHSPSRKRLYSCRSGPGFVGCGHTSIVADDLEAFVTETLLEMYDTPEAAKVLTEAKRSVEHEDTGALFDSLRADEQRLEDVRLDYADRVIDRATFRQLTDRIEDRMADTRRKLGQRPESVVRLLGGKDIRKAWAAGSHEWRRQVIAATFEWIAIGPPAPRNRRHSRFDPTRVHFKAAGELAA
jgi:DNA invertase Pin-like site-specific DNA recombinase